jgi:hypothetical protein
MDAHKFYPRFASERLKEALADTPVALIRRSGQSRKVDNFQRNAGQLRLESVDNMPRKTQPG